MQAARASTPDWTPSTPLSDIRNAHVTNTPAEMETALRGDANCLEADVRLAGDVRPMPGYRNRPVIAAHWDWDTHGLTLPEWLKVGSASGRMLKLDFKSAAAIRPALKDLKASGIPGERLMLNGGIDLRRGTSPLGIAMSVHNLFFASHTSVGILQEMRRAYPSALIALSPSHQPRAERDYRKISDCATAVGGPLTFPLAASMVDEEVVRRLKPYGSVSVYASEGSFKVTDVAKDTEHFRRMGVDGVIDLAQH
jgi:hypothetical protein